MSVHSGQNKPTPAGWVIVAWGADGPVLYDGGNDTEAAGRAVHRLRDQFAATGVDVTLLPIYRLGWLL